MGWTRIVHLGTVFMVHGFPRQPIKSFASFTFGPPMPLATSVTVLLKLIKDKWPMPTIR